MNILCMLGKHDWRGCKCAKCSTVRDTEHQFYSSTSTYGRPSCTCRICGKNIDNHHHWVGCRCTDCGKIRDEQHNYENGTCTRCGKEIPVDLSGMEEKDRALLIFDPKYSKSTRLAILDSVNLEAAIAAFKSFQEEKPYGMQGLWYSRDDEIAQTFLDRLSQDQLKELVSLGYWSAALKVEDTDYLIDECKKVNRISKYIERIDGDRKQAVLQALLEVPEMCVMACLAMGGHQRDKDCKCTRCGTIAHEWQLINPFSTATEKYRCRYCGAEEIYQL